jgi:hypothetical protein
MVLLAPFLDRPPPPVDTLELEYLDQTHSSLVSFLLRGQPCNNGILPALNLPRDKNQADSFMKALICHCHDFCHALWLLWNSHLHGKVLGAPTSYKHLHLVAQLEELYASAPHILLYMTVKSSRHPWRIVACNPLEPFRLSTLSPSRL